MHQFLAKWIVPGLLLSTFAVAVPADAAAQPDLKVRVLLKKRQRDGKWFVRARFRVYNVGAALAGPTTVGAWCLANIGGGQCPALDGDYDVVPPVEPGATGVVLLATPAIPAGANVTVNGPATEEWQPGNYTVAAMADFPEALAEAIEANNRGRAVIAIP
jgi:hypothetical protein